MSIAPIVQSVTVAVHPGGLSPLIHHRPTDGILGFHKRIRSGSVS